MKIGITFLMAMCSLSVALAAEVEVQPALKDVFKPDFLVGAALNAAQFSGADNPEVELIGKHFNTITPENVLKWEHVHPEAGRYDFSGSDRYVEFGKKHGMVIIGHTLIWHSQTPDWVFRDAQGKPLTREALLERMRDHIQTVVGRYKGRIRGWDVVNEAVNESGELRQSPWMKIIGEEFILKAYQFAREADPDVELYYNDFSLEKVAKRRGAVELVKKLQAQGVKLAGVGVQGHYGLDSPKPEAIEATIEAFAKLGLKVMITELDVNVLPNPSRATGADVSMKFAADPKWNPYTNGLPKEVEEQLAHRYEELFKVFTKERGSLSRVTFWGVTDRTSWLNDWPVPGRTSYPLLFDRECKPKPAFHAVVNGRQTLLGSLD
jgi:endo-1,4-beta-xylanase